MPDQIFWKYLITKTMNFISKWFEHVINKVHVSANFFKLLFYFLNYISPVRVLYLNEFNIYLLIVVFKACMFLLFELPISQGMLRVFNQNHSRDTSRLVIFNLFFLEPSPVWYKSVCVRDFSVLHCVILTAENVNKHCLV